MQETRLESSWLSDLTESSLFSSLLATLSARRGEVPEGGGGFESRPKQPRILVRHSTGHRDHPQREGNIHFSSSFASSMFQRAGEDPDQHEREEDGDVWRVELDQGHPHPHSLVWRRHWWTRWSPVTQSLNALQTLVVLCLFSVWIWLSCTRQYSWSGECE